MQNAAPVATPTPDIDPDEVRRGLKFYTLQSRPDEELPRRGGGTIGVGTLAYFQANNENQLQQAMLRRVIALEKALGRERARALLCERLGVEAESLGDLLCARSDLDAISDVMLAAGAMFDVGVEVLPDLSQQLPIHGPVRLPSMPIVPQPAPDVQAVKLCNCGKCCPGPLYSQHERDAAVAREREEVQSRAALLGAGQGCRGAVRRRRAGAVCHLVPAPAARRGVVGGRGRSRCERPACCWQARFSVGGWYRGDGTDFLGADGRQTGRAREGPTARSCCGRTPHRARARLFLQEAGRGWTHRRMFAALGEANCRPPAAKGVIEGFQACWDCYCDRA